MSVVTTARLRLAFLVIGFAGVVVVTVGSLIPSPPDLIPLENGDKGEHLLAYGGLMFWFAQVYVRLPVRVRVAAFLLALGIGLEYVQGWTGWREFSYSDMAADAIGIVLGWLLAPPRTRNLLVLTDAVLSRRPM